MNTSNPTPAKARPRAVRGSHQARQLQLEQVSPEARKKAAVVLEVLAGLRTPLQAAEALGMALPSYYHLELRALQGLMNHCEPTPKGRQKNADRELAEVRQQCRKLAADVQRYQALARATQKTIGLSPPPPPPKKRAPGKRPRKPVVRALQALALIKGPVEVPVAPAPPVTTG
jgi:hypothetical protein